MIETKFRQNRYALLLCILLLKALIACLLIGGYSVHLSPDEAQYWSWSKALDWGYYSKPPAIAWQIWITTHIFGSNEFGIRFGAVVISFFLALVVYHLAHLCKLHERICFWAALVMAFSPLGIFLSFAATTDGGSMLFLTLAIAEIVKGMEEKKGPPYLIAGLWIFVGALYKWTVYIFWPLTAAFALFRPNMRKASFFWGLIISILAFFPSFYWNLTHEWATFKHVGETLYRSAASKSPNPLDFFLAQVVLLSPVFFVLLVMSYFYIRKPNLWYCALYPFLLALYFLSAFFKRLQPNWGDFLYPAGMVLIAWVALEKLKSGKFWLRLGLFLAIIGALSALLIPWAQKNQRFSFVPISYKANPFRQSMGWDKLAEALQKAGYLGEEEFLFADRYQTTSLLNFYVLHKASAYFFNVNQERKNHFSYQRRMEGHERGKTGFFVLVENVTSHELGWYERYYPEKLSPYFTKISYAGSYPLYSAYGEAVKHAIIFKCEGYLGTAPEDPQRF